MRCCIRERRVLAREVEHQVIDQAAHITLDFAPSRDVLDQHAAIPCFMRSLDVGSNEAVDLAPPDLFRLPELPSAAAPPATNAIYDQM